jgi:pSer/pThr/pTyr-binding forkhead associated (FHA) protein
MVQRLVMRRGPTPGAIFDLTESEILIGRGGRCHIVIRDDEVSREHCRLVRSSHGYELIDAHSTNGTFVNGQRIRQRALQSGELIELGDSVTLRYEQVAAGDLKGKLRTPTEPIKRPPPPASAFGHYVVLSRGAQVGAVFLLTNPIVTVGREPTNDIVIAQESVSRYHLQIKREKTGYRVEDVGSTNGTYLNGEKLEAPAALAPDDVLSVGTAQLHYVRRPLPEQGQDAIQTRALALDDALTGELVNAIADSLRRATLRPTTHRLGTGLEPGSLRDHVLLLYTRPDWEHLAAPLMARMQDAGLEVWVDQYLAQGTDDWLRAVEQAADECAVMALVLSRQSTSDPQVKLVYRKFVMTNKPIVPMLVDGFTSSGISMAFEDAIPCDSTRPGEAFDLLIRRVQELRNKPIRSLL